MSIKQIQDTYNNYADAAAKSVNQKAYSAASLVKGRFSRLSSLPSNVVQFNTKEVAKIAFTLAAITSFGYAVFAAFTAKALLIGALSLVGRDIVSRSMEINNPTNKSVELGENVEDDYAQVPQDIDGVPVAMPVPGAKNNNIDRALTALFGNFINKNCEKIEWTQINKA